MQPFPDLAVAGNIVVKEKQRDTSISPPKKNKHKKKKKKNKKKKQQSKQSQNSECDTFEYEFQGAPWWMPINDSIDYQYEPEHITTKELMNLTREQLLRRYNVKYIKGETKKDLVNRILNKQKKKKKPNSSKNVQQNETVVDDYAHDISVKIVINNNPWLQQQIADKGETKRQYILSIDFQINCRKYILFTSLLLFIVLMTFLSSAYTGFYEFKGYTFNFIVIVILMYGIFTGFMCSEMNRYSTRTLLGLLNVYWTIAWIVIICLGITAFIYLILFPNKFTNYCKTNNICDATLGSIIFAEMSLLCTLILYILMMFFYMERIVQLVILISIIKHYEFKDENTCFMRVCHKHMYRYFRGWKAFRKIIGKHTGLRISDVLYCSCWFRKCRRNSSQSWQSSEDSKNKNNKYKDSTDSTASEDSKKKKKKKKASDGYGDDYELVYTREQCCWDWCDNINYNGGKDADTAHCWCLRDCLACDWRDVCSGCSECMQDVNICNKDNCCCCCRTYHTDNAGDCTICCKSILNIFCCGSDCDCGDCDGCGEAAPYICIVILFGGICIVTFLLPIIVFGCIAAPFWLLAQYLVWRLNDKVSWIIVIGIFVMFLIPPCFIWAYIWTTICLGNLTNKFINMMCLIWSFFHTIYSSLS